MKALIKNSLAIVAFIATVFTAQGQVKIGSNPTVITPTSNLEIEAANGHKTAVRKDNGFVGVGTVTPNTHLHVSEGNLSVTQAASNTFTSGIVGSASIGRGNQNRAVNTITGGLGNIADGVNSLVIGLQNFTNSAGDQCFVFGQGNQATAVNSIAGGTSCLAAGNSSLALGLSTQATGARAAALGTSNLAQGDNSMALGQNTQAIGSAAISLGFDNRARGNASIALGHQGQANGAAAVSLGNNNFAHGDASFAAGLQNQATGPVAFAFGYLCLASANTAIAMGKNAKATHASSFVFADGVGADLGSNGNNTMTMRFSGGTTIYSNGANNVGVRLAPNTTTWAGVSDIRAKKNITDLQSGLTAIMQLRPKKYHYKNTDDKHYSLGFIAQDVVKVLPDVVEVPEDKDQFMSIRYTEIIPVLTKAIQEQQAQIEALQKENGQLKAQVTNAGNHSQELASLRSELETLKALVLKANPAQKVSAVTDTKK